VLRGPATPVVFAEDIGKFPDLNIAESLNRIPGVQLVRDVNGDGQEIAIRGRGTVGRLWHGHAPRAVVSADRQLERSGRQA
jgi:hypothetical protein